MSQKAPNILRKQLKQTLSEAKVPPREGEKLQKRLIISYLIAHTLSSAKSIKTVIPQLLEIIGETFDWEVGILWLIDEEKSVAEFSASWSKYTQNTKEFVKTCTSLKFKMGKGILGKVWANKKAEWLDSIGEKLIFQRRNAAKQNNLRSAFIFPIIDDRQVLGIIEFFSTEKKQIDEDALKIVDSVSYQLAQFIKRKRAEDELKQALSQLQTVLESVSHGITAETSSGRIIYANDVFANLVGHKQVKDLSLRNIKEIFEGFDIYDKNSKKLTPDQLPAAKVFAGKKEVTQLLKFIDKETEEEKWFRVKATAIKHDHKKRLVIKLFQDVTKIVEEQEQQQLFLGIVSHEFRSPLASIKAYIQLLERRLESGSTEENLEFLANVNAQTDRLTKLVNDIMDTTRIKAGLLKLNKEVLNYSELVEKTVTNFQPTAPKNRIKVKISKGFTLKLDRDRITQVLVNLLSNAVNHSDEGDPVTLTLKSDSKCVITSVSDKGNGIPKHFKKKLFKLYSRGDSARRRNTKGLGMGLFIASAIVKSHNGRIWVDSQEGKGTTFHFCLPLKAK